MILSRKIYSIIFKNPEKRKPKEIRLISQFIKTYFFKNYACVKEIKILGSVIKCV